MSRLKKIYGFTLIELLVVVAIIGLLASITLGYLSSARKKGNDTAVKSNLVTVRSVSEIFYINNSNSYLPALGSDVTGTCPTTYNVPGTDMISKDQTIFNAIREAIKRGGNGSSCYNSANAWAVAVGLNSDANLSWCVDNSGASRQVSSTNAINGTTFLCN